MARQLFGTDGVRGVAGELPDRRARARARPRRRRSATRAERPRVLVIRDTRESGRDARGGARRRRRRRRAATSCSAASCRRPARRCCSRRYGFDLGVVVSRLAQPVRATTASSSSRADGFKLSDETEDGDRGAPATSPPAPCTTIGRVRALHGTQEDYLRALHERFAELDLTGARRRCSTAPTARPTASRRRSSAASAPTSTSIGDEPDGRNINDGCGSTHVDALAAQVARGRPRRRLRLRRRRRPRAGGRPHRRGRRRRRADRARRAAPARGRTGCPAAASR